MKAFFSIFICSWIAALLLPWWGIFIPAFIFGVWLTKGSLHAFSAGFFGCGLGWLLPVLYIHFANNAILSTRIADMVGAGSPWIILGVTFLVAAIPGGLGALSGFLFAAIIRPSKKHIKSSYVEF